MQAPLLSSPRNPAVVRLRELHDPERRAALGRYLIEGVKLAREALRSGVAPLEVVHAADLAGTAPGAALLADLARAGSRLRPATTRVLGALATSDTPPPIVCCLERHPLEVPAALDPSRLPCLLVACGVQDPGNLGALIRIAEAFGASALLAVGGADPWSARAARAAAGSLFRLPVGRLAEAAPLPDGLGGRGYRSAVALPRGGAEPGPGCLEPPFALWMGSEGGGLPEAVVRAAEIRLTIPVAAPVESLNVAAAAAVLLDRLRRAS